MRATGNPAHNGQSNDPMVGSRIGGVNVFGGGLALYDASGKIVGAIVNWELGIQSGHSEFLIPHS
jgi:uncharacterized protein GlcG (DUF336 family)